MTVVLVVDMNFTGLVDDGSVPPRAVFLDTGRGQITIKTAVKRGHDNCHSFPLKMKVRKMLVIIN